MDGIYEFKLNALTLTCNGHTSVSKENASNVFEAILYQPNEDIGKIQSVTTVNLWPNEEYFKKAREWYESDLQKKKVGQAEKTILLDLYDKKKEIESVLFKVHLRGQSQLEINVSIAEDNKKINDVLLRTIGTGVKLGLSAIPVIGGIVNELTSSARESLFSPADNEKLKSLGTTRIEITDSSVGTTPVVIKKDLVLPTDTDILPVTDWRWGNQGAERVIIEQRRTLKAGSINGSVSIQITKIN